MAIEKIQNVSNVSEVIVYNLSQQKRFFVDVTLKPSMAHGPLQVNDVRLFCDIFVFKTAS